MTMYARSLTPVKPASSSAGANVPAMTMPEPASPPRTAVATPMRGVRRRHIGAADVPVIASLLHRGFPNKSAARFLDALYRLGQRDQQPGFPQYGLMLEVGNEAVGALLTVCSHTDAALPATVRCNMACWFVVEKYRIFAPLLLAPLTQQSTATLINISPAQITLPTIEAQGFMRFSSGVFAGMPALAPRSQNVRITGVGTGEDAELPAAIWRLLRDHAEYGCVSFVCHGPDGAVPFVFRRHAVRHLPAPCAKLIYCRDVKDIGRFAGSLGQFLALRGMSWIYVATHEPIAGVPGRFFPNKQPMYFRGPAAPRAGDLAYTETAMFGF